MRIDPVLTQSSHSHAPGFDCHWIVTQVSQSSTSKDNESTALSTAVYCKSRLSRTGDNARQCQCILLSPRNVQDFDKSHVLLHCQHGHSKPSHN